MRTTRSFDLYPVALDVAGRRCLVVGGGSVAARKARALVGCGAQVTVVAPTLGEEMEALTPSLHSVERRPYRHGEAAGFQLVVTATGRPDVDRAVHDDAEVSGVWVNAADDRANSSFVLPAVHREGPVTVAVSTGGTSPALAAWLRTRLAAHCGDVGTLAELLGGARRRLLAAGVHTETLDWGGLLDGPLAELVRVGDVDGARAVVEETTDRWLRANSPGHRG